MRDIHWKRDQHWDALEQSIRARLHSLPHSMHSRLTILELRITDHESELWLHDTAGVLVWVTSMPWLSGPELNKQRACILTLRT